jgi:hypothetical protein
LGRTLVVVDDEIAGPIVRQLKDTWNCRAPLHRYLSGSSTILPATGLRWTWASGRKTATGYLAPALKRKG